MDEDGNAYVIGTTSSRNFPTFNPLQPAYGGGITDAFVAKLNARGSSLVYSTYLGGEGIDAVFGLAIDNNESVYLTGYTTSSSFPTVNALQSSYSGGFDAFVAKLTPSGSALKFSTYLGGSNFDDGQDISVGSLGHIYLAGRTSSLDFPTANPYQPNFGGSKGNGAVGGDAFLTKLSSDGASIIYSTYLGGEGNDEAYGLALDRYDNAYVAGTTSSITFPIINPSSKIPGNSTGGVFVAKFNRTGSALRYSTRLDGSRAESITVDAQGNAYVTGEIFISDQSKFYDAFVRQLSTDGSDLVFSTFVGGADRDFGTDIAVDARGNVYVVGATESPDFPTTPDALQKGPPPAADPSNQLNGFLIKIAVQQCALQ
jgi:hypothetical protein